MFLRSPGIKTGGYLTGSGVGFPFLAAAACCLGSTEIDLWPFLANLSASNLAIKSYLRCSKANFGLNRPSVVPSEKVL